MKMLLIDGGNTRLKWQYWLAGKLRSAGIVDKHDVVSSSFSRWNTVPLETIYVSSVGQSKVDQAIVQWAEENNQPAPVFVASSPCAFGVMNAYTEPSKLGVDRWLAMIAAHQQYTGMLCVIDSGTALTMDFLMPNGEHLGGLIVPGAELMKDSLLVGTDKIIMESECRPDILAKDTTSAVELGIKQMMQSFIVRKVAELESKYHQSITLVMTGGHAEELIHGLGRPAELHKTLVFDGLKLFAQA